MSAFTKAVGAATTTANKQSANQPQSQGNNPFGIAAVLLQGTQGKSGFRGSSVVGSPRSPRSHVESILDSSARISKHTGELYEGFLFS